MKLAKSETCSSVRC